MDPAYALLFEHVSAADPAVRLHAVMGLGLAYAGTQKEEVRRLPLPCHQLGQCFGPLIVLGLWSESGSCTHTVMGLGRAYAGMQKVEVGCSTLPGCQLADQTEVRLQSLAATPQSTKPSCSVFIFLDSPLPWPSS